MHDICLIPTLPIAHVPICTHLPLVKVVETLTLSFIQFLIDWLSQSFPTYCDSFSPIIKFSKMANGDIVWIGRVIVKGCIKL